MFVVGSKMRPVGTSKNSKDVVV
jgi:hypothetical protein